MSEPKILNLDDVALDEERVLVLDGVKHSAVEMTVESYLDRVKRSRLQKPDANSEEQLEDTILFLVEVYPTVTDARFRKLKLPQLQKVIEFTIAAPKDIVATAAPATDAVGNV